MTMIDTDARHTSIRMNGLAACEYFDVSSSSIGDDFRIFVATPARIESGRQYPVIYVLDGNLSFTLAVGAQRPLTMLGDIPNAFIVGIGYPTDDPLQVFAKRYRDYSPVPGGEVERMIQSQADPAGALKLGGGPAFLELLLEAVKPAVEARYPVDPHDATVVGVSLGGLWAAWVLLSRPETFQRYVLCSPSLWWSREAVWQWETRHAATHDDLPAKVFVSAGGLETVELSRMQLLAAAEAAGPMKAQIDAMIAAYDTHGWPRMAELMPELVERFQTRNYPSLEICCHNLPDETHMSVAPAAISRGLRYVFGHWRPRTVA